MSTRRQAREWAVQMLFQLDMNPTEDKTPEDIFKDFWEGQLRLQNDKEPDQSPPPPIKKFTENIVIGVMRYREDIDTRISACARNWDIKRIGGVERNVLRMGIFEIIYAGDKAPPAVVINEAVDICKFFGTRESGRFINGILDAVAKTFQKERETPQEWSPAP